MIKIKLQVLYHQWLFDGPAECTAQGNRKSLSKALIDATIDKENLGKYYSRGRTQINQIRAEDDNEQEANNDMETDD